MQPEEFSKYAVLYVDDEEKSLRAFARAFGGQFKIFTATTAAEGLHILETQGDDIGVLMTDQMMPGESGVWLLDKARQARPNILRIMATAFTNLEAVVEAVNTGAIYHYVSKPWDPQLLEHTIKHALQLFAAQRERDQLLREKMAVLHNMMVADRVVSLGFMAAGMSHHIRNSLVPIKTFIDLVPQQLVEEGVDLAACKNREFWADYHLSAQRHLDKINSLLKDLWVVAETPALGFTDKVHLREALADTTMSMRDVLVAKNIAVEIDVPDELPVLTVDKAKFLRIFELLIKDELVSLPAGSRITITARVDAAEGGRVNVVLRDNGPGLSEETVRTIFDPFNTRSSSPSEHGINLMACYFIVHYHGGKIEARSQAGQGTEFHLAFPLSGNLPSVADDNREFFQKIRATDELWEKLLSTR